MQNSAFTNEWPTTHDVRLMQCTVQISQSDPLAEFSACASAILAPPVVDCKQINKNQIYTQIRLNYHNSN